MATNDVSVKLVEPQLAYRVVGAFYEVYNEVGYGLPEGAHARALRVELQHRGIPFQAEVPVRLRYRGVEVGLLRVDLIVAGRVLVEVKSTKELLRRDFSQTLTYLKATGLHLGLLLHFGPEAKAHRLVL